MKRQYGWTRRQFLKGVLAASATMGAAASLAGCGGSRQGGSGSSGSLAAYEPVKVKMLQRKTMGEAPLVIAKEKGYLGKYGVTLEMVPYPDDLKKQFEDGSDRYVFVAGPDVLPKIAEGLPAMLISGLSRGCTQMRALADTKIKGMDVAGRTVGVVGEGSPEEITGKAALAQAGFDYAQATWVRSSSLEQLLGALRDKSVEVALLPEDAGVVAGSCLGAVALYDDAADSRYAEMTCGFLAGNNTVYVDDELCGRVATAAREACAWIMQNPAEAAQVLVSAGAVTDWKPLLTSWDVPATDQDLQSLCQQALAGMAFGDEGVEVFEASLKAQWQVVKAAGIPTGTRTLDDLVRTAGFYVP